MSNSPNNTVNDGNPTIISGNIPTLKGNFSNTSLRFRNLRGVDCSNVFGLTAWALAGCDLRGAKLPDYLKFDLLHRIEDAAKLAQTNFLVLLAAVFVCWTVRISISDAELIMGSRRAELPFVMVGVNITYFYLLSPLLIVLVYVYFQLGLQKIWESVPNLPVYFPDGLRIDKKIYPWPPLRVSELVFPSLWNNASRLSKARVFLTFFLFWCVVPTSLIAYWLHYLQHHDLYMSLWHVFLLIGALLLDVFLVNRFVHLLIRSREKKEKGTEDFPDHAEIPRLPADTDVLRGRLARYQKWTIVVIIVIGLLAAFYTWRVISFEFHSPQALTTIDIQNSTLQRVMLDSKDLDGLRARGADLQESMFTDSTFKEADFEGADLRGAKDITPEQLCEAKTLKGVRLDSEIFVKVNDQCSKKLELPDDSP